MRRLVARDKREAAALVGEAEARLPGLVDRETNPDDRCDGRVEAPGCRHVARAQPEVVDAALLRPLVVDRLDRVAVGIEHERPVVRAAVLGPRAGLAVALVAGLGHPVPPGVDRVAVHEREADVQTS